MKKRYDDKASKQLFGAPLSGVQDNHLTTHPQTSQQQISHIVFKDKYSHKFKDYESSSEEELATYDDRQ